MIVPPNGRKAPPLDGQVDHNPKMTAISMVTQKQSPILIGHQRTAPANPGHG